MKKYLTIDVESGGIEHDKSLLTVYLGLFDENFKFIDELYLYLKSPDDKYIVTAEALRINKIDLVEHEKIAVTYKEGGTKLYDFIRKHSEDGKQFLLPVGQNVAFDIGHIQEKLLRKKNWDQFVSYRVRDTGVVGGFLQDIAAIPDTVKGGLSTLLDFYKIPYDAVLLHDARCDAIYTLQLYEAMIKQQKEILQFWQANKL